MNILFSFMAGLTFGIGLIVAGMANPAKVLGFLDLAGQWDPSLAFVMAGGIAVASVGFAFARKRTVSLLGGPMQIPGKGRIDRKLVCGSLLFGIGWGLAGICPGPAWVLLGSGSGKGSVFVLVMLIGMALFEWREHRRRAALAPPSVSAR